MKRFGIIAAISLMLFGFFGKSHAQYRSEMPDLKGRFVYGFTFGGGFYNNYLNIALAPQIGYRIFNPWEVGVRGLYDFTSRFNRINGTWYGHYFGVSPYTNVEIFRGLFVHIEDEFLYGFSRWQHVTQDRNWFNDVFVGGGFRQYSRQGDDYAYFMILFNLSWDNPHNQERLYPYGSPIVVRVGYCFGR